MTDIHHHRNGNKGSFTYEPEGIRLAEMAYVISAPGTMIIEHTEVDESLKGQGIGKQLLAELVEYVRKEKIRVIPLCPFANAMFKRHAEWQDVMGVGGVKYKG